MLALKVVRNLINLTSLAFGNWARHKRDLHHLLKQSITQESRDRTLILPENQILAFFVTSQRTTWAPKRRRRPTTVNSCRKNLQAIPSVPLAVYGNRPSANYFPGVSGGAHQSAIYNVKIYYQALFAGIYLPVSCNMYVVADSGWMLTIIYCILCML